jgi:hypothetical protein
MISGRLRQPTKASPLPSRPILAHTSGSIRTTSQALQGPLWGIARKDRLAAVKCAPTKPGARPRVNDGVWPEPICFSLALIPWVEFDIAEP